MPGVGGIYPDSPIPYTLQSVLGGNIKMDAKIHEGMIDLPSYDL